MQKKTEKPGLENAHAKAKAFFQWCNYLTQQCDRVGKEPLYINLDESPVAAVMTHSRGALIRRNKKVRPRQSAKLEDRRAHFTYVAMVCNDPEVQPRLPQLLIVPDKMKVGEFEDLQRALPDNFYALRRKSAWNTKSILAELMTLLGRILTYLDATRQVIFLSDACPFHQAKEVVEKQAIGHFWVAVIPASLTWMLQPLDVIVFPGLKRKLRIARQEEGHTDGAASPMLTMALALVKVGRAHLVGTNWHKAFEVTGCTGNQDRVAGTLLDALEWPTVPFVSLQRPALDDVKCCWPRTSTPTDADLDLMLPAPPPPIADAVVAGDAAAASGLAGPGPLSAAGLPAPLPADGSLGTHDAPLPRKRLGAKTTATGL